MSLLDRIACGVVLLLLVGMADPGRFVYGKESPKPGSFREAKMLYQAAVRAKDMHVRVRARLAFARTRDLRALRLLSEEYASIQGPEERGTIVSMAARYFVKSRDLTVHRWWRDRMRTVGDTWLWFRGLVLEHEAGSDRRAVESARSLEPPSLRAAAMEALATCREPEALAWIPSVLAGLPNEVADREVLVGSAASVVLAHRSDLHAPGFRRAATALADLLNDEKTSARSARLVRRYLAATFGERRLFRTARQWRARIAGGAKLGEVRSTTGPRPEFFGLESTGRSVCYLIDMSDSMTTRLTESERLDFQEALGRVTGTSDGPRAGGRGTSDLGATRFDAVRAILKASLRQLPTRTQFAIVGFGTRASLLGPTKGLVRATRKSVQNSIQALDNVTVDEKGRLRGATNLHGALRIAFGLRSAEPAVTVNGHSGAGGAETMFILTDGLPNVDDWDEGRRGPEVGRGQSYGSFADRTQLLEDLHRVNLLRKAEIHCVGVGNSCRLLLKRIARLGLGMVRIVGGGTPKLVDTRQEDLSVAVPGQVQWLLRKVSPSARSSDAKADVRMRIRAIERLAELGVEEAVPHLVSALGAISREERLAALHALVTITKVPMGSDDDVATLDAGFRLRGRWIRWQKQNGR